MGSKLELRWTGSYSVFQLQGKCRFRLEHVAFKTETGKYVLCEQPESAHHMAIPLTLTRNPPTLTILPQVSEEEDCMVPSSGSLLTDVPKPGTF